MGQQAPAARVVTSFKYVNIKRHKHTYTAPFTGKGDQEVMLALVTVGSRKAVGKDAAVEIASKGLLNSHAGNLQRLGL